MVFPMVEITPSFGVKITKVFGLITKNWPLFPTNVAATASDVLRPM